MKRKTSQYAQVLAVLQEGPSTAPEMALETGLSLKHCSAYLGRSVRNGISEVVGVLKREPCPHCGGKSRGPSAKIYALIAQRKAA